MTVLNEVQFSGYEIRDIQRINISNFNQKTVVMPISVLHQVVFKSTVLKSQTEGLKDDELIK